MNQILLTIDVGNTSTTYAWFNLMNPQPKPIHPLKVVSTASLPKKRVPGLYRPHAIMITSVVPKLNLGLAALTKKQFKTSPTFINHRTPSQIKVKTSHPYEVGADRLVNARGAWALHQGPSIVIDFGTATTFDCVSKNHEYVGGVIAPGPLISAQALYQKTAKLPLVLLQKPARILGKTTVQCIQSGLYHGYRGLVREVVKQLKGRLKGPLRIFSTGGQAGWILKGLGLKTHYVPHLTHLGLYHYWVDINRRNISKK